MPRDVRQLLLRRASAGSAACAGPCEIRFVSSRNLHDVPKGLIVRVEPGMDAADHHIEAHALSGDLVITRDIPFAERLVARSIAAMNDRGDIFTNENIAERRSLRDAAAELRSLGLVAESPKGSRRTPKETKKFADALDRLMTRLRRQEDDKS